MSGRKTAGKASPFMLVLISIGCFFATYNFLTMVGHGRGRDGTRKLLYSDRDSVLSFASGSDPAKRYHVALTATDALYSQWQSRIMHYWYREMRDRPGSDMGGFTRVLHSGKPDELMDEIPTLVVDPLPEGQDRVRTCSTLRYVFCYCLCYYIALLLIQCFMQGYIVLNRPWAFVQWLQKAKIKEE
jgi:hydroxyproline O-arabinosyltransferase